MNTMKAESVCYQKSIYVIDLCDCCKYYTFQHKKKHEKSQQHQNYLKELSEEPSLNTENQETVPLNPIIYIVQGNVKLNSTKLVKEMFV